MEEDDKYSWGTPFNGIFVIDRCPTLSCVEPTRNSLEIEKVRGPSIMQPVEEVMQSSLLVSSHECAKLLQECLKGVLQVTTNDIIVDSLGKHLQNSSLSSSLENICQDSMLVSIQESLQDPSKQSFQMLVN